MKDVGFQTYIDDDFWLRANLAKWKSMDVAYEKGTIPLEECRQAIYNPR
jgi:hypothetical protein